MPDKTKKTTVMGIGIVLLTLGVEFIRSGEVINGSILVVLGLASVAVYELFQEGQIEKFLR